MQGFFKICRSHTIRTSELYHSVQSCENLSSIAARFHVSSSQIFYYRRDNALIRMNSGMNSTLQPNDELYIPSRILNFQCFAYQDSGRHHAADVVAQNDVKYQLAVDVSRTILTYNLYEKPFSFVENFLRNFVLVVDNRYLDIYSQKTHEDYAKDDQLNMPDRPSIINFQNNEFRL